MFGKKVCFHFDVTINFAVILVRFCTHVFTEQLCAVENRMTASDILLCMHGFAFSGSRYSTCVWRIGAMPSWNCEQRRIWTHNKGRLPYHIIVSVVSSISSLLFGMCSRADMLCALEILYDLCGEVFFGYWQCCFNCKRLWVGGCDKEWWAQKTKDIAYLKLLSYSSGLCRDRRYSSQYSKWVHHHLYTNTSTPSPLHQHPQ